jgi:hypothetical protein
MTALELRKAAYLWPSRLPIRAILRFSLFFWPDFPARNFSFVTGKILYRRGEGGYCLWSERSGKEIAGLDAGKPGLEFFYFGIIFLQLRKTVMILAPFLSQLGVKVITSLDKLAIFLITLRTKLSDDLGFLSGVLDLDRKHSRLPSLLFHFLFQIFKKQFGCLAGGKKESGLMQEYRSGGF